MTKMTAAETRIAKALIDNRIGRMNYGMLFRESCMPSMRDHMAFHAAGWDIDRNFSYITKDGEKTYKIRLQYLRNGNVSKRYSLEYLG